MRLRVTGTPAKVDLNKKRFISCHKKSQSRESTARTVVKDAFKDPGCFLPSALPLSVMTTALSEPLAEKHPVAPVTFPLHLIGQNLIMQLLAERQVGELSV